MVRIYKLNGDNSQANLLFSICASLPCEKSEENISEPCPQILRGWPRSATPTVISHIADLLDADRHRVRSAVAVSVDQNVVVAGGG